MKWKWYFSKFLILKFQVIIYFVGAHLFFPLCILFSLHLSLSFPSTWEGLSTCFMYKTPLLLLALMCSLLPWLKMNQPLCLLAVFEVESSKSWGVEQSQTKPTVPHAPSPSPSSLSNAKHTHTPHIPPHFWISFLLVSFRLVFCLLTVACQFVNGFVCSCACLNTKMTQQGGYCFTGGYTMEGMYLLQGMVLHCLLNALPDKEERRRQGVRWIWRAAMALIWHDKITDMFILLHKLCHQHAQWLKLLQDQFWWRWLWHGYVSF